MHRTVVATLSAVAVAFAAAGPAGAATEAPTRARASGPAPVPCKPVTGTGRYACTWYRAGDGYSGGATVVDRGTVVGYLPKGTNWINCQQRGAAVRNAEGDRNHWYGWTTAENGRQGWASPLDAQGGADFGHFAGVPNCRDAHGTPPATVGIWSRGPVGAPAVGNTMPFAPPHAGGGRHFSSVRPLAMRRLPFGSPASRLGIGGSAGGLVLPTYRAGIPIEFYSAAGVYGCTGAFVVRSRSGHPTLLTAGHCTSSIGFSGMSAARTIGDRAYRLGSVSKNAFDGNDQGRATDALAVTLNKSWPTQKAVLRPRLRSQRVTGVVPTEAQKVGTQICFSGRTTGRSCGRITDREPNLVCTSATTRPGDSGGPVYLKSRSRTTRALGLVSLYYWHGTADPGFGPMCYQPIVESLQALGLRW